MDSGVFIPFAALPSFSPAFHAELAEWIQVQMGAVVGGGDSLAQFDESEQPADLSVAQAKKFLDRVSDRVRATIRAIAEANEAGFDLDAVHQALGTAEEENLRGVWSGVTKRTRTVLGDEEASLIWWTEGEDGWVGRVSPMTYRSFRRVLSL